MIILFIVQAVVPQVNIKYVVDQQWLFYLQYKQLFHKLTLSHYKYVVDQQWLFYL